MASSTSKAGSLISDTTTLSTFLGHLLGILNSEGPAHNRPGLYLDLEGANLSRNGHISLLTLHGSNGSTSTTKIIDITTLQGAAFDTASNPSPAVDAKGKMATTKATTTTTKTTTTTLRQLLQDANIPKYLFDVRNDSDALFAHFAVALRGVLDIQLMENASRRPGVSKKFLSGLRRCVEKDAGLGQRITQAWTASKLGGDALWNPGRGGSYAVFDARPLHPAVRAYCEQDVLLLPRLRDVYWARLSGRWRGEVAKASMDRVRESQTAGYQPHGPNKGLGPWGFDKKWRKAQTSASSAETSSAVGSRANRAVGAHDFYEFDDDQNDDFYEFDDDQNDDFYDFDYCMDRLSLEE